MSMKSILWLTCCIVQSYFACSQVKDPAYGLMLQHLLSHSVREISVQEAAEKSAGIIFLDAREKDEFEVSHLKNALPVGYDQFTLNTVKGIDKDARIVVYCSVGYRSEKVAEQLKNAGFSHVANLYGGIFEWVNENHPVYDQSGKITGNVHAYDHTWGVWLQKGEKIY